MAEGAEDERDDLDQLISDIEDDATAFGAFEDDKRRLSLAAAGKRERKRARLTQSEIARRMATAQSAISALEAGKVDPQLSTAQRWGRAIGRRLDIAFVDQRMPIYDERSSRVLWHMLERKAVKAIMRALLAGQGGPDAHTVQSLAKLADIPKPAAEFILNNLRRDGWVTGSARRPVVGVNVERACIAGLHVQRGEVRLVLTDLSLASICYSESSQISTGSPRRVVETITGMVRRAQQHCQRTGVELLGIGVVLAGIIDPRFGDVIYAPDLDDAWTSFNLQGLLSEELGLGVVVENDANALAMHEYLRSGDDQITALLISAGVGSCNVVRGRTLYGAEYAGGELGM